MVLPLAQVETAMLAGVRVAAFLVVAPPFAQRAMPARVRAMLALGLALAILPRAEHVPAASTADFVGQLVLQAVAGAALGFLVALTVSAVQSAGALLDLFGGFQMASAFDPASMTSGAPLSRLYQTTAVVLLFATGGYQVILAGLARSVETLPLSAAPDPARLAQTLTEGFTGAFVGALQIAGPLLVVLFLTDVGLGLLTRVAPALNAFVLGFPLKILLTLTLAGFVYLALPEVVRALATTAARGILRQGAS